MEASLCVNLLMLWLLPQISQQGATVTTGQAHEGWNRSRLCIMYVTRDLNDNSVQPLTAAGIYVQQLCEYSPAHMMSLCLFLETKN